MCVRSCKGRSGYMDHFEVIVRDLVIILLVDDSDVGIFRSGLGFGDL